MDFLVSFVIKLQLLFNNEFKLRILQVPLLWKILFFIFTVNMYFGPIFSEEGIPKTTASSALIMDVGDKKNNIGDKACPVTSMPVTDDEEEMCWWRLWPFWSPTSTSFFTLVSGNKSPPTLSHQHQNVTNITVPTSTSYCWQSTQFCHQFWHYLHFQHSVIKIIVICYIFEFP